MRNKKTFLGEGLFSGDLQGLVLPTISVDEYVSKIDDNAIVFGFYVHDEDAANDLNKFIQRSAVSILDSDVSPAPDQHGYYMVFVELIGDEYTSAQFDMLLKDISALACIDIKDWKLKIRGKDKKVPYSEQTITDVRNKSKSVTESISAFLAESDLSDAEVNDGAVRIGAFDYIVAGFGDADSLMARLGLDKLPLAVDLRESARARCLAMMLGEGWDSAKFGDTTVIFRTDSTKALFLSNHISA